MAYSLDGDQSALNAVCLTTQTKPTGRFLFFATGKNPVLDSLTDLHELHRADFEYSVTDQLPDAFGRIAKGKSNLLICTASIMRKAKGPQILSDISDVIESGRLKGIILINDSPEDLGYAQRVLGIHGNEANVASYVVATHEFRSTIWSVFAQYKPDIVTDERASLNNFNRSVQARTEAATRGVHPNKAQEVADRIKSSAEQHRPGGG